MKCPLLTALSPSLWEDGKVAVTYCWKEECACWDETQDCCSEVAKNRALFALVDLLTDIRDKMPHEGQFKK